MTEKEYGKLISRNLKRLAFEKDKTQADISHDLGISKQTISSWMNGTRTPKMKKIDLLCEYFGCKRSDIMEEHEVRQGESRASVTEEDLIKRFRTLNSEGKTALFSYMDYLQSTPKFTSIMISRDA